MRAAAEQSADELRKQRKRKSRVAHRMEQAGRWMEASARRTGWRSGGAPVGGEATRRLDERRRAG
jgi:hypothetical protein